MLRKILIFFIFYFLFLSNVFANDNISIKLNSDKNKVGINETFNLYLSIDIKNNIKIENINIKGLEKFYIKNKGIVQSYKSINLNIENNYKENYILLPNKIGKFTIGPAIIEIDGKIFESNLVEIEILDNSNLNNNFESLITFNEKIDNFQPKNNNIINKIDFFLIFLIIIFICLIFLIYYLFNNYKNIKKIRKKDINNTGKLDDFEFILKNKLNEFFLYDFNDLTLYEIKEYLIKNNLFSPELKYIFEKIYYLKYSNIIIDKKEIELIIKDLFIKK